MTADKAFVCFVVAFVIFMTFYGHLIGYFWAILESFWRHFGVSSTCSVGAIFKEVPASWSPGDTQKDTLCNENSSQKVPRGWCTAPRTTCAAISVFGPSCRLPLAKTMFTKMLGMQT